MLNWSLLSEYNDKGLLQLPNGFTSHDLNAIKAELPRILAERTERTVMEADGKSVRSVYGVHQHNKFLSRLARHPQLLMMAQQILQDNVYVYQSKVNLKLPFAGDVWDWHQDYPTAPTSDPVGPRLGAQRLNRGGSWIDDPRFLRIADRSRNEPATRLIILGFRIVRSAL